MRSFARRVQPLESSAEEKVRWMVGIDDGVAKRAENIAVRSAEGRGMGRVEGMLVGRVDMVV